MTQEYRLRRNERIRLNGDEKGRVISCGEGILWLTQTGNPGDHLLRAGETFSGSGPGRLVIGALADSVFTVAEGGASPSLFAGVLPQAVRQAVGLIAVARRRLWT